MTRELFCESLNRCVVISNNGSSLTLTISGYQNYRARSAVFNRDQARELANQILRWVKRGDLAAD